MSGCKEHLLLSHIRKHLKEGASWLTEWLMAEGQFSGSVDPCGSHHLLLVLAAQVLLVPKWQPHCRQKIQRQKSGLFLVSLFKREKSLRTPNRLSPGLIGQNPPIPEEKNGVTKNGRETNQDSLAGLGASRLFLPCYRPPSSRTVLGTAASGTPTRGKGGFCSLPGPDAGDRACRSSTDVV